MKNILVATFTIFILNSCATIIGGSKYKAHVYVHNSEGATITYNGQSIINNSQLLIKRKKANQVIFNVKKEGCKTESFHFKQISFRGGAFASSLIFSLFTRLNETDQYGNIVRSRIVPIQIVIDLLNYSSLFKPNKHENGISKTNFKLYTYTLDYKATPINPPKKEVVIIEKDDFHLTAEKLRDLKKLLEEEVIDEEEYKLMKQRIIGFNEQDVEINETEEEVSKESEIKKEEEENKTEKEIDSKSTEEPNLNKEKLNDLNKMLELGLIDEKEFEEMKEKLIEN